MGDFETMGNRPDVGDYAKGLGVSRATAYNWVSHIIARNKATREVRAWRLSQLGWTQTEIGSRLGVERTTVSLDVKNGNIAKIHTDLPPSWNKQGIAELAKAQSIPLTDCYAAAMAGMDDIERLKRRERFEICRRRQNLSWTHHREVGDRFGVSRRRENLS